MLKTAILHPQILAGLGRMGHSSKILIADGNYPFATKKHPAAEVVHLNFSPGMLKVTEVLGPMLDMIPIELVEVMEPMKTGPYAMKEEPAIFGEFRKILAAKGYKKLELTKVERFDFYEAAAGKDVALVIATGEGRIYANILLTVGVVRGE